ncbi:MAG TPA: four helix bundle protein [Chitinophagaceae bacterium]|nr:four helix bundle protein [Chitinophagaceae bacterium]MCC6180383.1 four helix bundle protein [Bacteroidia bacterium]HNF30350.1 four helix bundle protein [Chitinophagaceae bacterium]HNM33985.1 four helix bundle protein [Chitinophagaceae bacterium]
MKYVTFEDMNVWKNAMEVATLVFNLTTNLPRSEDYGLTSQLRRSALSVSANIAEGYGRESNMDKIRFYVISRGSAFETKSHLIYGEKVNYFENEKIHTLNYKIDNVIFELNKIIKTLKP